MGGNDVIRKEKRMSAAEIRDWASREYVASSRQKGQRQFSIRVGDIVREHKLYRSVPAVCNALKTEEFLKGNNLTLVDMSGPKSGLSTTVVYTYEFLDSGLTPEPTADAWSRLRGALKEVFSELGGGEAYLRAERNGFYRSGERK